VIFGYFPSLESNPPEAGPANETHQSNEEEAEGNEKASTSQRTAESPEEGAKGNPQSTNESRYNP